MSIKDSSLLWIRGKWQTTISQERNAGLNVRLWDQELKLVFLLLAKSSEIHIKILLWHKTAEQLLQMKMFWVLYNNQTNDHTTSNMLKLISEIWSILQFYLDAVTLVHPCQLRVNQKFDIWGNEIRGWE